MAKIRSHRSGFILLVAFISMAISTQFMLLRGRAQQVESRIKPKISYEEAMIRWAYLKLMYYNSIANKDTAKLKGTAYKPQNDLFLEVRNVHTGNIAEIYDKILDNMVTKPSGAVISLMLYSKPSEGGVQRQIAYNAEWMAGQYTSAVVPQNVTFREALQVMGEKYADVKKYSTYEVTIRLAGVSKGYKAMVLYHGAYQSSEEQKPDFLDTVVGLGGVITDIWNETRPPIGATRKKVSDATSTLSPGKHDGTTKSIKPFGCDSNQPLCCPWGADSLSECKWNTEYSWDEPKYSEIPRGNDQNVQDRIKNDTGVLFSKLSYNDSTDALVASAANSCTYTSRDNRFSLQTSRDSKNHFEGDHAAHTQINVRCTRTTDCTSTCDPYLDQSGYNDFEAGVEYVIFGALLQPSHVGKKQGALDATSDSGSSVNSLTCKGGAGYAFESCLFASLCSVSLSVSWSGATLNASGGGLWNAAHSRTHTCAYSTDVSSGGSSAQCGQSTGAYCFLSSNGATCNQGTVAIPPCCCFWSPIVIDISRYWDWTTNSGTGYQFTDAAGGVRFDLTGDGSTKQVAWPTATSENAWLVLDRNGNGIIDNGKELFGNFTDQVGPNGEVVPLGQGNGWQALAEFDRERSGGNDNGIIDRGDAVFQNLRLWVDRNHNGISEPNELLTLPSIGLTKIELSYGGVPWTDQYGNNFRLKGRFVWGDLGEEPYVEWYKDAWDVYPQWTP